MGNFKLKGSSKLPFLFKYNYERIIMEKFKIYSVSDEYIDYLRKVYPNVYSNKAGQRFHTRKYIGIVLKIKNYNYYIPMSSPKPTDYQIAGEGKVIKRSIVPIMRIVTKNSRGEKELKGTLRISHMIPVPDSELEIYDLDNEIDSAYKDLVQNEIIYIRKQREKIQSNAELMYKQKKENDQTAKYVKAALEFEELEKLCDKYQENQLQIRC